MPDLEGLHDVKTLDKFLAEVEQQEPLPLPARIALAEQALSLIAGYYVHLPLKRALHAVDPERRLTLLRQRLVALTLAQSSEVPAEHAAALADPLLSERAFHAELISIFTSLRDLHTTYYLPPAYHGRVAFLPFLLEQCRDAGRTRYVVSKVTGSRGRAGPRPGAIVTHWNGVAIERVVERSAELNAGSNPSARHARGLQRLTFRPLDMLLPPEEAWVDITYRDGRRRRTDRFRWKTARVRGDRPPASFRGSELHAVGVDDGTERLRRMQVALFASRAPAATIAARGLRIEPLRSGRLRGVLRFGRVHAGAETYGYLRVYTFSVDDADAFVADVRSALASMDPTEGLVLDIRGNPGGMIAAAERTLGLFSAEPVRLQPLAFRATESTRELAASERVDFTRWRDSLNRALAIGAPYSDGYPLMAPEARAVDPQAYGRPVVLVVDALCYSAADMFAAGFQDNRLGKVLGTSHATGAGGADVWSSAELRRLLGRGARALNPARAGGAYFGVALRRTTRVGDRSGVVLEDYGVAPDEVRPLTRRDVLEGNVDLVGEAIRLLRDPPPRWVDATYAADPPRLVLHTRNLARVDVLLDGQPLTTIEDARDDPPPVPLDQRPARQALLRGYDGGDVVSSFRLDLPVAGPA